MTMPNLYLIQDGYEYRDYDTYDSAVVCANSEEEAKCIHPDGYYIFINERFCRKGGHTAPFGCFFGWIHPNEVQVTLVGVAAKDIQAGTVICASYNAG